VALWLVCSFPCWQVGALGDQGPLRTAKTPARAGDNLRCPEHQVKDEENQSVALLETSFRLSQTTDEPGDKFHQPRCLVMSFTSPDALLLCKPVRV